MVTWCWILVVALFRSATCWFDGQESSFVSYAQDQHMDISNKIPIDRHVTKSLISCAIRCHRNDACAHYQFDDITSDCLMYSRMMSSNQSIQSDVKVFSVDTDLTFAISDIDGACNSGSSCDYQSPYCESYPVSPWKCGSSEVPGCTCQRNGSNSQGTSSYTGSLNEVQRLSLVHGAFRVDAVTFRGQSYLAVFPLARCCSVFSCSRCNTATLIYKFKPESGYYEQIQSFTIGYIRKGRFFVMEGHLYLWLPVHIYYSNNYNALSYVYRLDPNAEVFGVHQSFKQRGPLGGCAGRRSNGELWVGSSYYYNPSVAGLSANEPQYTYKWDLESNRLGNNIPIHTEPSGSLGCEFYEVGQMWLYFSASRTGIKTSRVFKMNDTSGTWELLQSLNTTSSEDVHPFQHDGIHYCVRVGNSAAELYRYEAVSGNYSYVHNLDLGGAVALRDVDHFVSGGDMFILISRDGSGVKSNIFKLVNGTLVPFLLTPQWTRVHEMCPFTRDGKQFIVATEYNLSKFKGNVIIYQWI